MQQTPHPFPAWIYRSTRKDEMYLYLGTEDGFDAVPPALLQRFGRAEFVMRIELHPGRSLARADVASVIQHLVANGYYLQMPPKLDPDLFEGD